MNDEAHRTDGAPVGEKRRSERVAVDLWIEGLSAGNVFSMSPGNIGTGGLFASATKEVSEGQIFWGHIVLPGGAPPIFVLSEVAHVDADSRGRLGCGVRFLGINDWAQMVINGFVRLHLETGFPIGRVAARGPWSAGQGSRA